MKEKKYLGIDLGAGSGRGIIGEFDGNKVKLKEIYRFENHLYRMNSYSYWDFLQMYSHVKNMISKAYHEERAEGIGIDTWALDYGLVDRKGQLLGNVISYRSFTGTEADAASKRISRQKLFWQTGVGYLPFNTAYQLFGRVMNCDPLLEAAETMLLLPDLFMYYLTGVKTAEYTGVAATMLMDHTRKNWSEYVLRWLALPERIFAPIVSPCTFHGKIGSSLQKELDIKDMAVYNAATHDTASATAAIPSKEEEFVYISSGTWSLIGTEVDSPVISDQAYEEGFSNEGSIQTGFRLNRNIMGLGILQECKRQWTAKGRSMSWEDLVNAAETEKPFAGYVDMDAPELFDLQDTENKLHRYLTKQGTETLVPARTARILYESLALKYRYYLRKLEKITGKRFQTVYITGGGSKNRLLNQFTANATGLRVIAGPAEGACMANVLAQCMAEGEIKSFSEMKEIVGNSEPCREYYPKDTDLWTEAYEEFLKNTGLKD